MGPGCDIPHRSAGASDRCPQCKLGRARQAEWNTARTAKKEADALRWKELRQAKLARRAAAREAFTEQRLRELITPDETPKALTYQRDLVRGVVSTATGIRPSLKHLTIGQAEGFLKEFGKDPDLLWRKGRGNVVVDRAAVISRWFIWAVGVVLCLTPVLGWVVGAAVVVLVVIACFSAGLAGAVGVLILGAIVVALMPFLHWVVGIALAVAPIVLGVRRKKRQEYEDQLVSLPAAPVSEVQADTAEPDLPAGPLLADGGTGGPLPR